MRFFSCGNDILLQLSLGVIKNVSFDSKQRQAIEKAGLIPKIIELLGNANFRYSSIVILYLLSLDDKNRESFAYAECITLVSIEL